MSKSIFYTCTLGLLLLFTACKQGKKKGKGDVKVIDTAAIAVDTLAERRNTPQIEAERDFPEPVIGKEKQKMIANVMPLWERKLQYSTFSGKAKMHYEDARQKQDFNANFRVLKDSAIWVSVTALGGMVSVARALVTPDSIYLINYLQKTAYAMSAAQAGQLLPVQMDFDILQNLIMGDVLSRSGMLVDAVDFGAVFNLHVMDARTIQQINYSKADSTLQTLQMITNNGQGSVAAFIRLGNYEVVNNKRFASGRAININNNGDLLYMSMDFSKAEFDEELSLPFRIPSSYQLNPPLR